MGDIFDDVMAMENADLAKAEEVSEDAESANFNADELEDIMAEIDNLEQDFGSEAVTPIAQVATPAVEKMVVAKAPEIEQVVEAEEIKSEFTDEVIEDTEEIIKPGAAVLTFEKKQTPAALDFKSNVSLAATGNMTLNLTFKIGDQDATLIIDQEKGLLVSFSGVELTLHGENGCKVEMANGVSFSVPVQNTATGIKKKSA